MPVETFLNPRGLEDGAILIYFLQDVMLEPVKYR